jgi:uncharacterized protein (TIGR00730 family)
VAVVCVFCASSRTLAERWFDLAREVGEALGDRGHSLVSGGGCIGMMGALADGARAAGAHTLGVIPQSLVDLEIADRSADELVITDGMAARKVVMIERADAFLILPGGLGTLDELFEVWTTGTLGLHGKPVILLDVDGFYGGLVTWLRDLVAQEFVRPEGLAMVQITRSVGEALDAIDGFR